MANKLILAFVIKITPEASGGRNCSSVLAQDVPILAKVAEVDLGIEEPLPWWEISICSFAGGLQTMLHEKKLIFICSICQGFLKTKMFHIIYS